MARLISGKDPKTVRVLKIMEYLRQHRSTVTAAQIAEKVGASSRQIYRDLEMIEQAGIPLEHEKGSHGGGFQLHRSYFNGTGDTLMAKITAKSLQQLITKMTKYTGAKFDTVVVGTDKRAQEAREALAELELDYHVIADDEIGSNSVWVTSQDNLSQMAGGGRN